MYDPTDPNPPKPHTVRPREAKVIQSLVSGEAKTLTAALRQAGFHPSSRTVRDAFTTPGTRQHDELVSALKAKGITVERVAGTIAEGLEANKTTTVAGEPHSQPDTDNRLRAADAAIKMLERAGELQPMEENAVVSPITVNILQLQVSSGETLGPSPNVPVTHVIDNKDKDAQ